MHESILQGPHSNRLRNLIQLELNAPQVAAFNRKEQTMMYLFLVWCAMAAFVLSLAMYRKVVARSEDDLVHLGEADDRLVNQQKTVASRLEFIDRWERILTIVTIAFGLVVGVLYLYNGWMDSSTLKP